MKFQISKIIPIAIILTILLLSMVEARELGARVINPNDYSDIWLGFSTGGYNLIAEKGNTFVFELYVKNGMPDRTIHNLKITQGIFPFEVNSVIPKEIESIKPMEIVLFKINTSIPIDAPNGKNQFTFDISADEFPIGVFKLESEIKVVDKINLGLYATYTALIVMIFVFLFYRKYQIKKEKDVNHERKKKKK